MSYAPTTTIPFKSSLQLQTKKASSRSVSGDAAGFDSSNEASYWAHKFGLGPGNSTSPQFAHPLQVTLSAGTSAIVHQLYFAPTALSPLLTVSGPRLQLYGTTPESSFHQAFNVFHQSSLVKKEITHDRQIQTGGQPALCAAFRNDGRLLAIGTDRGHIRIVDAVSRATLCTWKAQSGLAIRTVLWFRDGQHLMAAGDDGLLTAWRLTPPADSVDIIASQQQAFMVLSGHGDAIRCADLWQLPATLTDGKWPFSALAATGSYDHTIRLWQMDTFAEQKDRCHAILWHGAPVESVLWIPSSDPSVPVWLISAGGTKIKVWNPLSGACVNTVAAHHRKTITTLLFMPRKDYVDGESILHNRILTGGLDGLLRIHAWDSRRGELNYLHGISLNEPITAMAANVKADRIAIGTSSGSVLVRQRGPSIVPKKRKREPKAGTYAFFTRGKNADPLVEDYVVAATGKKRKLRSFDVALRQFRYGDALDDALETRVPQIVVAVLEELGKRRGLTIALSNRDEESLEPILSFTARYVARPRFTALLVGVSNILIDIYGDVAGQSETIDELFDKLKVQVAAECRAQKALFRILGQIDAITTVTLDDADLV